MFSEMHRTNMMCTDQAGMWTKGALVQQWDTFSLDCMFPLNSIRLSAFGPLNQNE